MRGDWPLLALVTAAVASYPAIALSWCVAALLTGEPAARELWLGGHPGALVASVLVGVGVVAVGNACRVLVRGLWHTHRFHRWVSRHRIPVDGRLPLELGADDRVRLVAGTEQLAVTVGLWRPYVVLSSGLVAQVSGGELRAVLAHEHAHVRRRDPLRLLFARVLAAHLWFLPLATDMRGRSRAGYELAADRHAAERCGRAVVASALLRVTARPETAGAFVAAFAERELLEARVSQLESGRPPRPATISRRRAVLTAVAGLGVVLAVAGAWAFMLLACPCVAA